MEKFTVLMLWPPYLAIRATHWVVYQILDTYVYVKEG